jgi:hypothetical protein
MPLRKAFGQDAQANETSSCLECPSSLGHQEVSQPEAHPNCDQNISWPTKSARPGNDHEDAIQLLVGPWVAEKDETGGKFLSSKRSAFQSERWSEPWSLSHTCTDSRASRSEVTLSTVQDHRTLKMCVDALQAHVVLLEGRISQLEQQLQHFGCSSLSRCEGGDTQSAARKQSNPGNERTNPEVSKAHGSSGLTTANIASEIHEVEALVGSPAESDKALNLAKDNPGASMSDLLPQPSIAPMLSRSRSCTHSSSDVEDVKLEVLHSRPFGGSNKHVAVDSNATPRLRSTFGATHYLEASAISEGNNLIDGTDLPVHMKALQSSQHGTHASQVGGNLLGTGIPATGEHRQSGNACCDSSGLAASERPDSLHVKVKFTESETHSSTLPDHSCCLQPEIGACARLPDACLAPAVNDNIDTMHGTPSSCIGSISGAKHEGWGSWPSVSSLASSTCTKEPCSKEHLMMEPLSDMLLLLEKPGGKRIYSGKIWLSRDSGVPVSQMDTSVQLAVLGSLSRTPAVQMYSSEQGLLHGAGVRPTCWTGDVQTTSIGRISGAY